MKTNSSRGKELSGGSIIMTASGKLLSSKRTLILHQTHARLVAGLRSGAGTVDCKPPY